MCVHFFVGFCNLPILLRLFLSLRLSLSFVLSFYLFRDDSVVDTLVFCFVRWPFSSAVLHSLRFSVGHYHYYLSLLFIMIIIMMIMMMLSSVFDVSLCLLAKVIEVNRIVLRSKFCSSLNCFQCLFPFV